MIPFVIGCLLLGTFPLLVSVAVVEHSLPYFIQATFTTELPSVICLLYCLSCGSTTAVGGLMLIAANQHATRPGVCRMVSVVIITAAIIEAGAISVLPAGLTMAILFPVFGSFETADAGDGFATLIVATPDGDAETPGLDPTIGSDIECDPEPEHRGSDDLSDACNDAFYK